MRNICPLWKLPGLTTGFTDQDPEDPRAIEYPTNTLFRSSDGSVYYGSQLVAKLRPYPYVINWWR